MGFMGIMEKKMETTTMGLGFRVILGIYWDNGKENGSYYSIQGLYRDYILIPIGSRQKPPATSTVDAQQFTSTICNHGAGYLKKTSNGYWYL